VGPRDSPARDSTGDRWRNAGLSAQAGSARATEGRKTPDVPADPGFDVELGGADLRGARAHAGELHR